MERVFSQVSIIKTNKRTRLSNDTLLLLSTDQVPLQDFCPDAAVDLWWRSKSRRPDQRTRRPYRQHSAGSSSNTPDTATDDLSVYSENDTSDSESDRLHDWDKWMCDSNSDYFVLFFCSSYRLCKSRLTRRLNKKIKIKMW